ncbi:hypothetical protein AVT69_gp304 [Pseudomonas phage PhiPA3]|uniref:Uncharacterized protein 306 n=1 Tax=Pseudomonas phage PhiPA3 TaxID=998086 RepID=F8SJE2_BPPA3|nr:hypothetical protein AVT69_gp304 [Pseudomonas phage PhiPA3]AEH03729.1 hypothetical protein [Pseudomonas phage PhiPA3]
MTIYFEGNGESKPVTLSQTRDQFMLAIKNKRDEVLSNPLLETYEDPAQRDRVVADATIKGVLQVLDGESNDFPAVELKPFVPEEDITEAKEAGADYLDPECADFGQGLAEYWNLISS